MQERTDSHPLGSQTLDAGSTFDVLGLSADIMRGLAENGYMHPTPVQLAVYEPAIRGKNLVVQARTGTGKTASFGLPLLEALIRKTRPLVQGLVLVPTRELALQVSKELKTIGKYRELGITCIYGGTPIEPQISELENNTQLVIGTPGRTLDHLRRGTLKAEHIKVLVLDEADEILSMGFARELYAILDFLPKERQGLFFSATIPPGIERLAKSQLDSPEFITLSSDQIGADEVTHYMYHTSFGEKKRALLLMLELEKPESAILFCNTKDETEKVSSYLEKEGYLAAFLNGDLEQKARERVMAAARKSKIRFLVATDVAARGIDISHVTHVINYDFPESCETYIHRTGRTGRAGRTGTAISLVEPKDIGNIYLLRLTYKLKPITKFLPTAQDMKARHELDTISRLFFLGGSIQPTQSNIEIAKRILTHDLSEQLISTLVQMSLGEKQDWTASSGPRIEPDRVSAHLSEGPEKADLPKRTEAHFIMTEKEKIPPKENVVEENYQTTENKKLEDLFLNLGRRDQIRPSDIIHLLQAEVGLSGEQVIKISVRDRHSFVKLNHDDLTSAIEKLNGLEIQGKPLVAERARGSS